VLVPSQAPPQLEPSLWQAGRPPLGAEPAGLAVQVPIALAWLQAAHWPVQAVSQQTPSTQKPEVHWLAPPQAWPFPSLDTHWLAEQ
jgi:hypothetical protein